MNPMQKERIKNKINSYIATFMGLKVFSDITDAHPDSVLLDELIYHESLDAMLPVINKINSLGFRFIISPEQSQIFEKRINGPYHFIIDSDDFDDIVKNTWHACYAFAKWYNKKNQDIDYQI